MAFAVGIAAMVNLSQLLVYPLEAQGGGEAAAMVEPTERRL
jgi:hypothetical protein